MLHVPNFNILIRKFSILCAICSEPILTDIIEDASAKHMNSLEVRDIILTESIISRSDQLKKKKELHS